MADETSATWVNLWREAKGPLVEAMKWKTVLLSEVKRDSNARRWNGKQITIPIFFSPQQGAGGASETGNLNTAVSVDTGQTVITTGIVHIPVTFSNQVLLQAKGDENVWAEVMPTKMQRAEDAFGRVINEMMTGAGDALLAATTASDSASGSTTQTVTVGTSANFYQLYPGRVCSYLVRSSGALPAGLTEEVKIVSRNPTAGTLVLRSLSGVGNTSFASDNTMGIYIQGSWGKSIQGLQQAIATSGSFQSLSKTNNEAWQGVDASPSGTTDPSLAVLDSAERAAASRSGKSPDFYLGDPAVIDKYTQGLTVQARWAGEEGELKSGWTGVRYRNKLLVPDYDMPLNTLIGTQMSDCNLYTLMDGPDWDDHTGSVLQRFGTRNLVVEAWLVWMLQFGFQACNGFVKVGNLTRAS